MHEQINEIFGYLHGLWRYRWSALLIAWLVAVVGWIVVYAMPDQYQAKAAVNIDTTSIMKPLLKGLAVETDPTEELAVVTRMLLNRENLLTVIRETDMDLEVDTPEGKEHLIENLARSIYLVNTGGRKRYGPRANIFEIAYQSNSPELAFKVVSTLLNQLIENTLSSGRTDTVKAQEFLDEQISEYEQRLTEAETRLVEFKKENVGVMPDEKGGYYARLRRAQEKIDNTKSSLRLAQERYAELGKQLSGESPVLGDSQARSSAARLRKYREQLAELLTKFTEEHPDVQSLRAKIGDLQANANAVGDQGDVFAGGSDYGEFNPVYQELKVALSQARIEVGRQQILLAEQQKNLEELQSSIDTIPQVEAELVRLNRDYEITKERYLSLVERRESARLAQKVGQSSNEITFRIVDAPVVPVLPSGPNRPILLAGVLLAALGAGAAWSLVMFLLFPTFVDYKQLRKMIDLPVLGAVNLQMTQEQRKIRSLQLRSYLLGVLLLLGIFGGVLFYEQPGSAFVRSVISNMGIII